MQIIDGYIKKCMPSENLDEAGVINWNVQQAAPSPTILPSLKFHDLVFGKVLGEGTFSVVKYGRHINRVGIV
jgi:hypothetical protein